MVTFASATVTYDDPVVSTIQTYVDRYRADLVFEHDLLLNSLFRAGKMPGVPGERPRLPVRGPGVMRRSARELWLPIATGSSSNTQSFRGADKLNVNVDDVGTRQKAIYAYYTGFTGIFKTESWENMGPEAVLNILQDRTDMELRSLTDAIETDLHSTNADTNTTTQKDVMGLQHLIDPTPTASTCWDLNRATITQHRNQVQTVTDTFANVGLDAWRDLDVSVRGTSGVDGPDMWLTTSILFNAYAQEIEDRHMTTSLTGTQDGAVSALNYKGVPVIYDDRAGSGTIRGLNLDYFRLLMPPGADFTSEPVTRPIDQAFDRGVRFYVGLQWGITQHRRQGVITGFTDA